MFYLQAGVHFQEEEVVVLVDEFHGAGVVVANCFGCFHGGCTHCFFHAVGQARCWCFFNQFLVSTLRRAVAGRDPHHVAVLVTNKLYFNVSRPCEVALDINFVAAEECFRLALCRVHCFLHLVGRLHHFHSAATATECSLDCYWPTKFVSEIGDLFCTGYKLGSARHDRCSAAQGSLARRNFVAHFNDGFWWRPDKCHTHVGDGAGEVGVLAEESVARVHAVGAALANGIKNCFGVQITFCCRLAAKRKGFVGEAHMQRVAIQLGIHGNGGNAHLASGADDAYGDFAAVGYQDLFQHE